MNVNQQCQARLILGRFTLYCVLADGHEGACLINLVSTANAVTEVADTIKRQIAVVAETWRTSFTK